MAETSLLVDNGALSVHLDHQMRLLLRLHLPLVTLNKRVVISRLVGFLVIRSNLSATRFGDFNRRPVPLLWNLHNVEERLKSFSEFKQKG